MLSGNREKNWEEKAGGAVRYSQSDRIGLITLARPANRNSMTPELLSAFGEAIDAALTDHEARGMVQHDAAADPGRRMNIDAENRAHLVL